MATFTSILSPTLVAEGSYLQGKLEFYAHALIFGLVEGTVLQHAAEPLHVGKSGWVQGDVHSEGAVEIEGRVDGDIHCTTLVRILPTGTVRGNIHSPRLEVQPGADIEGTILMKNLGLTLIPKAA